VFIVTCVDRAKFSHRG